MASYWIVLGVIVLVAGLPMVVESRLRNRHPEAYRELVSRLLRDDVKPKRFRSELLWRFLTQRRHKTLNDPFLSILSDLILGGMVVGALAFAGGIVWILATR